MSPLTNKRETSDVGIVAETIENCISAQKSLKVTRKFGIKGTKKIRMNDRSHFGEKAKVFLVDFAYISFCQCILT